MMHLLPAQGNSRIAPAGPSTIRGLRTDQTFLCPSCALRFSPAGRCPCCGSDRLSDLSDAKSRRLALEAMRSHGPGAKRALRLGRAVDRLAGARNRVLIALPLVLAILAALVVGH